MSGQSAAATPVSSYRGNVILWDQAGVPRLTKVDLPAFVGNAWSNSLVTIANPEKGGSPDASNCYCFGANDARTTYVHAYYWSNRIIEAYNRLLSESGSSIQMKGISLHLFPTVEGRPTTGSSTFEDQDSEIKFSRPGFDATILAHEFGHLLHALIAKVDSGSIMNPDGLSADANKLIVTEGIANLFSALIMNEPRIGRYEYMDAPTPIDVFMHYPDQMISSRDTILARLAAPKFSAEFPEMIAEMNETLSNQSEADGLLKPDPYFSSATFNQPLWKASRHFGVRRVFRQILDALKDNRRVDLPPGFAKRLVSVNSAMNADVVAFLKAAFQARGLIR